MENISKTRNMATVKETSTAKEAHVPESTIKRDRDLATLIQTVNAMLEDRGWDAHAIGKYTDLIRSREGGTQWHHLSITLYGRTMVIHARDTKDSDRQYAVWMLPAGMYEVIRDQGLKILLKDSGCTKQYSLENLADRMWNEAEEFIYGFTIDPGRIKK